jgi:hypothetical protein
MRVWRHDPKADSGHWVTPLPLLPNLPMIESAAHAEALL